MIARIPLTGKQLSTMNLRPEICRKAGAQIINKELVGGKQHLTVVKKELQDWIASSGQITLEMELAPIVKEIDKALSGK